MIITAIRVLALTVTVGAAVLVPATGAGAAPSCVAQSVQAEHQLYGTAWGHDVIAFLASDRELLAEFGFDSFGELAAFAASQDPASCPEEL